MTHPLSVACSPGNLGGAGGDTATTPTRGGAARHKGGSQRGLKAFVRDEDDAWIGMGIGMRGGEVVETCKGPLNRIFLF